MTDLFFSRNKQICHLFPIEVKGGKASAAKYSLPRLCQLIEQLKPEERPALVRGDNAFGNEGVMARMEALEQRYLFKLRQTAGVKRLIERKWKQRDWQNVGQGFDAVEGELQLANWIRARRVVVLRRRVKGDLVAEMPGEGAQSTLPSSWTTPTRSNSGNTRSW